MEVGRVVYYRTHEEHRVGDWLYPAGTSCLATRAPSGELALFFLREGPEPGDAATALWLPAEYGLCGVEPGVLNPLLRNMGMVNEAVRLSDARVGREMREESSRTVGARQAMENSILDEMQTEASRAVGDLGDRYAVEALERDARVVEGKKSEGRSKKKSERAAKKRRSKVS